MSFYTHFLCYRAGPAPGRITGNDLTRFIRQFVRLGVTSETGGYAQIKYGDRADGDDQPTSFLVPTDTPGISKWEEMEWDFQPAGEFEPLCEELARKDRPIYRASVNLGLVTEAMFAHFFRPPWPENEVALCLDRWSFAVEPIRCRTLDSEDEQPVGWMALRFHGRGYLYPWSFADLIEKTEASAEMSAVRNLCRMIWPTSRDPISPAVVHARKAAGELWPHSDYEKPFDWEWGLQEG